MGGWIQDNSNLYVVVDKAFFPIVMESSNIEILNGNYYDSVFAETVDQTEEIEHDTIRSAN